MKSIEIDGHEIVVCNSGGTYYAFQRRCGHMNAPLEMGTLSGKILTCAMHCSQFDITSGEALSGPVPPDFSEENPPQLIAGYLGKIEMQMKKIRVESIVTYPTRVEAGWVHVAL